MVFGSLVTVASPAAASPGVIIQTIIGNGDLSNTGDDGPASAATVFSPRGVTSQGGEAFIATDNVVRRIDSTGLVHHFAGNGSYSSSGDGGPAASAGIGCPSGLAHDGSALFIAESCNHRVRMVRNGTITTVAGTGLTSGSPNDGLPATTAALVNPSDIAVGPAGLYIADRGHRSVRVVDEDGIIDTLFAGSGCPTGVAVEPSGHVWVADPCNNAVLRISPTGSLVGAIGGTSGLPGDGGPVALAGLVEPSDVALDAAGTLYILESGGFRVRAVNAAGVITTVAGTGQQGFSGDGGPAALAQIGSGQQLHVDASGSILFTDTTNQRVRSIGTPGPSVLQPNVPVTTFPSDGCASGTVLVAHTAGGVALRISTVQADADTRWVCVRADGPSVAVGGRFEVTGAGVSGPGTPTTDSNAGSCATAPGNTVPGPHPLVDAALGDPAEPETYLPVLLDTYAGGAQVWLCVRIGSQEHRVVVPAGVSLSTPDVTFLADPSVPHVTPAGAPPATPSGTCQAAGDDLLFDASALGSRAFLYAKGSRVCVRLSGPVNAGGLLTVGTNLLGPLPSIETSTTDMSPCTVQVADVGSPADVEIRRSATGSVPASICVTVGGESLRVTVGPGNGGDPASVTWTPDPGTPGLP